MRERSCGAAEQANGKLGFEIFGAKVELVTRHNLPQCRTKSDSATLLSVDEKSCNSLAYG
jgi:hypothetical protein